MECAELRKLKERARIAVEAYLALTEDPEHLRSLTGLSQAQIDDAIQTVEDVSKAACAGLVHHTAAHGCFSGVCEWSGRGCHLCGPSVSYRAES